MLDQQIVNHVGAKRALKIEQILKDKMPTWRKLLIAYTASPKIIDRLMRDIHVEWYPDRDDPNKQHVRVMIGKKIYIIPDED